MRRLTESFPLCCRRCQGSVKNLAGGSASSHEQEHPHEPGVPERMILRLSRFNLRRGWIPVLLVLSLHTALPAAAAESRERVARVEQAVADWYLPTARSHHFRWLGVEVRREIPADGSAPTTIAHMVRGICSSTTSSDGQRVTTCIGPTKRFRLRASQFSMDSSGSSARVTIRTRRFVHSVRWSTNGVVPDGAYAEQEDCSGDYGTGVGGGAGASQSSVATGRVFGKRVTTKNNRDFAALDFGAVVSQC